MIAAEAEANAVKLAADAESYRLEAIGQYITDNTIKNAIASAWDGKLPAIVGGDIAGIMNLEDLILPDSPETTE